MDKPEVQTIVESVENLNKAWAEFWKALKDEAEFIAKAEIVTRCTTHLMCLFNHYNQGQYIFMPEDEDGMSEEDLKTKSGPLRGWFVRITAKNAPAARAAFDGVSWETGIGYNPWQYAQLVEMGYSEKTWEQFCEFYEYEE